MNNRTAAIAFAIAFGSVAACDRSPDDMMAATDMMDVDELVCPGMGGPAKLGAPCTQNDDCASGVCSIFRDAPRNSDAECIEAPESCGTRMTGTLLDFETQEPMAGMPLLVVGAHDAIVSGSMAPPIVVLETNEHGRFDGATEEPIQAPLAVLALTATAGYVLTASGLVQPEEGTMEYPVGAGLHDVWCVPTATLAGWSEAMAADESIPAELLPLPGPGVIVGVVRDPSGQPIQGAVVGSIAADSGAIVRYAASDGTLNAEATTGTGKFVILNAATPETFVAFVGDQEVGRAMVGVIPQATFVSVLQHLYQGG